jgi:hypothetical protein
MTTSLGALTARRVRRNTRRHLAGVTRSTRSQQIRGEDDPMFRTNSASHAVSGGVASTHRHDTSEELPMVEPIPLRRPAPASPAEAPRTRLRMVFEAHGRAS